MVKKHIDKILKHSQDNDRRKESLKSKFDEKQSQLQLITSALSDVSCGRNNKKIVFSEDNEELNNCDNGDKTRNHLFDDCDEDVDELRNFEIKIKSQFEGRKGQKLLNLQSRYNNDERFKLDERFKEDDEDDYDEPSEAKHNWDNGEEEGSNFGLNEFENEKAKQLKMVEGILGKPLQPSSKNENKKSSLEMVRYDPKNYEHKRLNESEEDKKTGRGGLKLEKGKREKRKRETDERQKKPKTSDEKFYKVSDDLRTALRNRASDGPQFSLLDNFSRNNEGDGFDDDEDGGDEPEERFIEPQRTSEGRDRSRSPDETREWAQTEATKVQGIVKEKFFFSDDDPRFEEGLSFINKKNSEEARSVREKFDETRPGLREVLRLRWKKHCERKNPFRKKIGGGTGSRSAADRFRKPGKSFRNFAGGKSNRR